MAFRLSKDKCAGLVRHRDALEKAAGVVADCHAHLNAALEEAVRPLNDAIRAYNDVVALARAFVDDIADEFRSEYDGKSERWQESDRGQTASAFVEAWQNVDLDEVAKIEIVEPDEPELHADALNALPEEAE